MTAKGYTYLFLGLLALGLTIALSLVTYQAGTTLIERLETEEWLQWMTAAICSIPIIVLGIGAWYVVSSLRLRLCRKAADVKRAQARVSDFTPTERGFAPRLIEGKVVNPNVVPSAVTPLDAAERPEEVPEERRLAGVVGWHLSNAPGQQGARQLAQRTALPIPKPEPSPWEVSHVEKLLLEAGDEIERGDREGRV
jgi:hypothetical protein